MAFTACRNSNLLVFLITIAAFLWIYSLKGNVTREEKELSAENGDSAHIKSSEPFKAEAIETKDYRHETRQVAPRMERVIEAKDDRRETRQVAPHMERVMKILDHNPLRWRRHIDYYNFTQCPYSLCAFTDDPLEADLAMVSLMRIKNYDLPPRKPGALLLVYTKEPPTFRRFRFIDRAEFRNSVNWTRTVFADSTFRARYADIRERSPPTRNYDDIFDNKKLQVAWFVSHCVTHSRREEYVARLSKKIQVDIYGRCSNRTCGKYGFQMGGKKTECLDMLSRDYKFYISFENSMCSDYVTEKFYNMYEGVDIIPIVRSGGNYGELAPKETFINTKDFSSPEELGDYLVALSKDKRRYTKMLRVKDRFEAVPPINRFDCALCEALHTKRHVNSVYQDYNKWLQDHCWEPTDL